MATEALLFIAEVDARDPPVLLQRADDDNKEEEEDEDSFFIDADDYEADSDDDDASSSSAASAAETRVPCADVAILDAAELRSRRDALVRSLAEIAAVSEQRSRSALRRRGWDIDRAIAELPFVRDDDAADAEAAKAAAAKPAEEVDPAATFECPTCMDDVSMAETRALGCGHRFCVSCWRAHVELGIREGRARRLACMARGCSEAVDGDMVRAVVQPELVDRYEEGLLSAFVEEHKRAKWCPSAPACGRAAVVDVASARVVEVSCPCGLVWCHRCRGPAHFPATCEMAESWQKLLSRGLVESSYMRDHCKQCPHCKKWVVKEDGCDLISCTCGKYFCWKCGGPTGFEHTWDSIAGHSCEEWIASQKKKQPEHFSFDTLPHDLEGRLGVATDHHQVHIFGNDAAAAIAETHAKARRMLEAAGMAFSQRHISVLDSALGTMRKAKRILSWSYVFGFYAFRAPGKVPKALPAEITADWDTQGLPAKTLDTLSALFNAYQGRLNDALSVFTEEVSAQADKIASWETLDRLIARTATINEIIASFYELLHVKLAEYFPQVATTVSVPSVTK